MMLDRSKGPEIKPISNLRLPQPKSHKLDNGIMVYETNMGTQEVVKLEIVFFAGRPFEHVPLVARTTSSMLKEGTQSYSSAEIAEAFDFYGASLSSPVNLDTSNLIIYSLNRHFATILPIVRSMLKEATFPEAELKSFIQRQKQSLKVQLAKPDVVAYRKITEFIFGEEHPYGYNSQPDLYQKLNRTELLNHYRNNYTATNCVIFISGMITPAIIEQLNKELGQPLQSGEKISVEWNSKPLPPKTVKIKHPNTVQTAIRIGRKLFDRHHPDYNGMYVLNTVLGGYFGSRLMTNIREDKGFTYNIYSTIDAMHQDGCFYIGTEVGNEFVEKTVDEIYKELRSLQADPIDADEIEMVRNYLMGYFLTMLDGPFNVADIVKTQVLENLPMDYFETLVQKVSQITPEELQELAKQYLNPEQMWQVIVGA